MKQRNGFVSNSSSSSFVLIFDKKPTNHIDCALQVFNLKKVEDIYTTHVHAEYHDEVIHGDQVARMIYEQLLENEIEFKKNKEYDKVHSIASGISRDFHMISGSTIDDGYYRDSGFNCFLDTKTKDKLKELGIKCRDADDAEWKLHMKYTQGKEGKEFQKALENKDYITAREVRSKTDKIFDDYCLVVARKFLAKLKKEGKWVGYVGFGDDDGPIGAVMEHGNAFDKIKHIRINCH
ncbi:hypothetical protein ACFLQL_04175 [Verrucomicrobiota bacterium]